ncbi:MAG: Tol-Pal system beta propeller repeat protein TolB [Gemmatimonadaceae bacterium]
MSDFMTLRVFGILAVVVSMNSVPIGAQDTTLKQGVRIGLSYQAAAKPGVVVLPVAAVGGDSIRAVIQRDLDNGDRVTIIAGTDAGGVDVAKAARGKLNYGFFSVLGAAAIVQATPTVGGLHVALHDVAAKRILNVRDFALPGPSGGRDWRYAMHGVADEVERWITGTRGIAQTRVAFVRQRNLYVIDSDGAGERVVVASGNALSPAWHPSGRYLVYTAMGDRGTHIVVRDLVLARDRPVALATGGLNITPAFGPEGRSIVYAHGQDDGTDLYAVPFSEDGSLRRITVGRGTDNVSPSFSPDGRRIAFTSGRAGHPEVYITDADGTNVDALTAFDFGDQFYRSNPDWAPDGRTIAFQSQIAGTFQVMTVSLRDRAVKQHTSEGRNEDPSWAPDSRHLVFTSTRTGTQQLWVLDIESGRARQLTHGSEARMAAWSPRGK